MSLNLSNLITRPFNLALVQFLFLINIQDSFFLTQLNKVLFANLYHHPLQVCRLRLHKKFAANIHPGVQSFKFLFTNGLEGSPQLNVLLHLFLELLSSQFYFLKLRFQLCFCKVLVLFYLFLLICVFENKSFLPNSLLVHHSFQHYSI